MEPAVAPPSYWLATCGDDLVPRPRLPGDRQVDVCVVGAGYSGLWTAYHLTRLDPTLRVAVVEAQVAGWGASGRNGGWCSALFAASWPRLAREHGRAQALRMRATLEQTVDDVGAWAAEHDLDVHYARGGTLRLARSAAQLTRLRAHVEQDRAWGGTDSVLLEQDEARARVGASGVRAAKLDPHCAAVHPALLARGLAGVVEQQGVALYEGTPAVELGPGRVRTPYGDVRADVVVRATEGYTADLPGNRRTTAPIWSLVVATEPLPDEVWEQLGWRHRETVNDERHLLIYAQRTADGRIVFGGRGAPYRWGSGTSGTRGHARTHGHLEEELRRMFPAAAGARVTHRWGGVLGVARDWMPSVGLDRATGMAWAGGYVGDGVACSALAGRTLADLVLGRDTDLVSLPWVQHRSRRWEPEPLRWLGVHGIAAVMSAADRGEQRSGRPSRVAAVAGRLLGH